MRGWKLVIAMALVSVGACGDDGVGSDSTSEGTETGSSTAPTSSSAGTETSSTGVTTEGSGTESGSGSGGSESGSGGTESGSGSGGSESGSGGSESGSGSGSESGSGSGSGSSSSTSSGVCTEIDFEDVLGEGFSGNGACEGVMGNFVLDDQDAVTDHNAAYCDSLTACFDPDPDCPPAPALELDGSRVVYAQGTTSGCSGSAVISEIFDCGDSVEVHYVVSGVGPCGLVVYGWDAALIPDGPDVTFIED